MKIVRVWGILVFILLAALIAGTWYLFVDNAVRSLIEKKGTRMVGAKVELQKADLSLFPLGFTLTGLSVADPDRPMTNLVEVSRLAFLVDPADLLRGKVIIDEMTASGVRLNGPRKKSGAIKKQAPLKSSEPVKAAASPRAGFLKLPAIAVPDVKEILKREELKTLKLAHDLRREIKDSQSRWQKRLDMLPDEKKIGDYEKRMKKLKKAAKDGVMGAVSALKDVKKLRDDISGDIKNIKEAKKDFSQDIKELRKKIAKIKEAPGDDLARLKKTYSISPEGLSNLSGLLFGGNVRHRAGAALRWYGKIKPLLESGAEGKGKVEPKPVRGKGVDIHFSVKERRPEFLIRKAGLDIKTPAGNLKGVIKNITSEQPLTGAPTTFRFSGEKLDRIKSIDLTGEVNRLKKSEPADSLNINMTGYRIEEMKLSGSEDFPLALDKAFADVTVRGALIKGDLDAVINAAFSSVVFTAGDRAGRLAAALGRTLSGIKKFSLKARVTGEPESPLVSVSSDLDAVLKKAVGNIVKEESSRLERELKVEIEKRVAGPLAGLDVDMAGLNKMEGGLSSVLGDLKQLLAGSKSPGLKGFKLPF